LGFFLLSAGDLLQKRPKFLNAGTIFTINLETICNTLLCASPEGV